MNKRQIKNLVAYGKAMKMMSCSNFTVNPKFILETIRNCGYNAYTAIADITDNSLESQVGAKNISVTFEVDEKKKITAIIISDDGCGMDFETLAEALALGSETGKDFYSLGRYGSGMKTSSFSLGKILEVFTKTEEGNLLIGSINLDDAYKDNGVCNLNDMSKFYEAGTDSEVFDWFISKTNSTHGTVVRISNLDGLTNRDLYSFSDTLRNRFGEIYNKFIINNVVDITVNGKECPCVDLMASPYGSKLLGSGDIVVDGLIIKYKAYYLPRMEEKRFSGEKHIKVSDGLYGLDRGLSNQGFYLYRCNRLVGKALTLGMYDRHSTKNGFRCELFFDGDCDYLFGSTFTKIVTEKVKSALNQSLRDALDDNIAKFWNQAYDLQKKSDQSSVNKEEDEQNKAMYSAVTEMQNKNKLLKVNRKPAGKSQKDHSAKRGSYKKSGKYAGINNSKWFDGFREEHCGFGGEVYFIEYNNNLPVVVINKDHPLYTKLFSKLPMDLKTVYACALSCTEIAREECGYYYNPDIKDVLDAYNNFLFCEIAKSLMPLNEPEKMDDNLAV